MLNKKRKPLLIVVSAPSGTGKTTLCERLLRERDDVVYSVSCTTRPPRGQEVDGRDYFFVKKDEFMDMAARHEFMEYARVHDHFYGTPAGAVNASLAAGRHVLLDIDVQGAAQIREYLGRLAPDNVMRRGFVDIFIAPPSLEELEKRLISRGEDAPEVIATRVGNARREMNRADEYRYYIVNDDLEKAYRKFREIIERESGENGR